MSPVILGAALGFVIGLAGFIIVQFWIRPILGYRKLKAELEELLKGISGAGVKDEETRNSLRRLSVGLVKSHDASLPSWYRIRLRSRGENPSDACTHLMALANIRNAEHAGVRAGKIKDSLNIR